MDESELFGRCSHATAQKVLSGKWTMLVMRHLEDGPMRFNELQRRLPDMTAATLSKLLKRMESDGLVVRNDYGEVPPRVEYALSPIGSEFRVVTDALGEWGERYIGLIRIRTVTTSVNVRGTSSCTPAGMRTRSPEGVPSSVRYGPIAGIITKNEVMIT